VPFIAGLRATAVLSPSSAAVSAASGSSASTLTEDTTLDACPGDVQVRVADGVLDGWLAELYVIAGVDGAADPLPQRLSCLQRALGGGVEESDLGTRLERAAEQFAGRLRVTGRFWQPIGNRRNERPLGPVVEANRDAMNLPICRAFFEVRDPTRTLDLLRIRQYLNRRARKSENRRFAGTSKRLKGLEPSTFCMASRP
jgi:hypothetical protein